MYSFGCDHIRVYLHTDTIHYSNGRKALQEQLLQWEHINLENLQQQEQELLQQRSPRWHRTCMCVCTISVCGKGQEWAQ